MATLRVQNFRSHIDKAIELSNKANIITGFNGSGKTSLLEAVAIALNGKSWRSNFDSIVRSNSNSNWWRIDLNLGKEIRTVKYINSKKTFIINNKCFNRFPKNKRIPIVLFEPSDMQLVYGSPLRRRNFFDRFIAQLDYEHQVDLNKFDRINRQRNKLIREYASKDELFAWNIQLSTLSEKITSRRSNFLDKIKKDFTDKYTKIANKPDIATVEFLPNTKKNASSILKYLDKTNDIIGAGRDDFLFTLNSLEAKSNASRGENRTIMFALLSSIVDNIRSNNNEAYILLDDIDSELDKSRRDNLYNLDSFKKNLIATTIRYNGKACKQIKLTD